MFYRFRNFPLCEKPLIVLYRDERETKEEQDSSPKKTEVKFYSDRSLLGRSILSSTVNLQNK